MRQLKIEQSITNREAESLSKYFTELSTIDMIDADQEIELTRRIRNGDEQALQALVKANLRFVVSVAKKYQNYGIPLIDLSPNGEIC